MARAFHPRAPELLNRADTEQDPTVRATLLRELQTIAHHEALTIPIYQMVDLYGVRNRVTDFVPSADTILRLGGVGLSR
jgi:ABC-type transport system substrate-binding protein